MILIIVFLTDHDGSRRMRPEYRETNNFLFEAQESNSTVLIFHFQKKSRYGNLSDRVKKTYDHDIEKYYAAMIEKMLDWNNQTLGGSYDVDVLNEGLDPKYEVLKRSAGWVLVKIDIKAD